MSATQRQKRKFVLEKRKGRKNMSQNLETTVAFIDYLKSLKGFVSSEAAPIPIVQK